ncbi:MAG: hypothetical protein HXY18_07675 [Bryobacteraceae bacterium]|nr:hypothetical protein [Bryobacteraceae bacterium]
MVLRFNGRRATEVTAKLLKLRSRCAQTECSDTFLMPAPAGSRPHTARSSPPNETAIVSVTTMRNSKDQTVILRVGGHLFIRHDSTNFCGDAMIVDAQRVEKKVAEVLAVRRENARQPHSSSSSGA